MKRRDFLSAASATLGAVVFTQAGCGSGGGGALSSSGSPSFGPAGERAFFETARFEALAFASSGTRYALDAPTHTLSARTPEGGTKWIVGGFGSQPGKMNGPTDVVEALNGRVYVVDAGNARVQAFDKTGAFVFEFGSYGTGDGQFLSPNCIDAASNGQLYITDAAAHRVLIFSVDGTYLSSFGGFGLNGSNLNGPMGIAVLGDEIYIVDAGNARVQVYTLSGTYLRSIDEISSLLYPFDIEVNTDGVVYVSDPATGELITFDPKDKQISRTSITHGGSPASPQGLALDNEQRLHIAV